MQTVNLSAVADQTNKPINLLFHQGDANVVNDRPDVVEINPVDTILFSNTVSPEQWEALKRSKGFMGLFRLVFPDIELGDFPLQSHGSGVRHVVGLLVLTFRVIHQGKTPFWRNPEAHLHPLAQLGLGDLLIAIFH